MLGRREYNRWCKVERKRKEGNGKEEDERVREGKRGKREVENATTESDGSRWQESYVTRLSLCFWGPKTSSRIGFDPIRKRDRRKDPFTQLTSFGQDVLLQKSAGRTCPIEL